MQRAYVFSAPTGELPCNSDIQAGWNRCRVPSPSPSDSVDGTLVVVNTTAQYHALARALPGTQDACVEIGSAYGDCTSILASRSDGKAIGIDISSECVQEASIRHPNISFHEIDVLRDKERLVNALSGGHDAVFIDINGNRTSPAVAYLLQTLFSMTTPRLVVVKNSELHKLMYRRVHGNNCSLPHRTKAGIVISARETAQTSSTSMFEHVPGVPDLLHQEANQYAMLCAACNSPMIYKSRFSSCWPTLRYCSHECRHLKEGEVWEVIVSDKKWLNVAPAKGGI